MLTFPPSALRVAGRLSAILVLCSAVASAKNWDAPAENLAAKIVAVTAQATISFEFINRSSLDNSDAETIRRTLIDRLLRSGLKFTNTGQAAEAVKVSLSENLRDYVWVAEIRRGSSDPTAVMVSTQRPTGPDGISYETPALIVRNTLLWSSDEQILDADIINGSSPRMVVLYSNQIKLYKLQIDHWVEDQTFSISHSQSWPRDLRGRLVLRKDHGFDAYLPGVLCQSADSSTVNCRANIDPWPVGTGSLLLSAFFAEARNFFTGGLSPGIGKQSTAPAFYTVAPIPRERYTLWFMAATDGRIHILDGTNDTVTKLDWGSEIATVRSRCGSGWHILASHSGTTQEDTVQAFEVSDRQAVAVGQAAQLSGGVTSLWTDAEEDGAIAVVRNFQTGKYEVHLLTIHCGL